MSTYNYTDLVKNAPKSSVRESLESIAKIDPVTWSMLYRRIGGQALKYDNLDAVEVANADPNATMKDRLLALLKHRPFLIEPLVDQHPDKTYKKGRQVGVSETELTEAIWGCDVRKMKWVYTFPRDTQLKDFSTTRVKEVRNESQYMANIFGETDQVYLKSVGKNGSFLFFRSAWDANLGEGIDADAVTFDEKDRMREGVETAFEQSLMSSPYGYIRRVSTPTIANRGVDEAFQKSDQRFWFVRCTKCNLPQQIVYPDNVVQVKDVKPGATEYEEGTFEYLCRKAQCRGKLDRMRGEWVAMFPEIKERRGYHIPQTIAPWISATKLMTLRLKAKLRQHWENYSLAICSSGESATISEDKIAACYAGHAPESIRDHDVWEYVTVGIDWGTHNWVTVYGWNSLNNVPYIINLYDIEDVHNDPLQVAREIAELLGPMAVDMIVADAGYGKAQNAYLHRVFGERFFACNYDTSPRANRNFKPVWNENAASVRADRTTELKGTMQALRDRAVGLPDHPLLAVFTKHLTNLIVLIEEDEQGYLHEVVDAKGEDHFAHSFSYARLGMDRLVRGESGSGILEFW